MLLSLTLHFKILRSLQSAHAHAPYTLNSLHTPTGPKPSTPQFKIIRNRMRASFLRRCPSPPISQPRYLAGKVVQWRKAVTPFELRATRP